MGFTRSLVAGSAFKHVLYAKSGNINSHLHIYLDGDGTPWIAGRPADDPTPRDLLVLTLMALDPAPAVYVGRPCYHGFAAENGCPSRLWLSERYSAEVVFSLAAVVAKLIDRKGVSKIVWFGYSGGGALAVLLAPRFSQTQAVVTIAANLDTQAWAKYAGADLIESLNPASGPPLPHTIRQYHYAGSKDGVVPPALMIKAAEKLGSRLIVIPDYGHVCCWRALWPTLLDHLNQYE